jgi:hypothetical protein
MNMKRKDALFWVIGQISEDLWKDVSQYSIWTSEHDSVMVCVNKIIIQQNVPTGLKQLSLTMRLQDHDAGLRYVR